VAPVADEEGLRALRLMSTVGIGPDLKVPLRDPHRQADTHRRLHLAAEDIDALPREPEDRAEMAGRVPDPLGNRYEIAKRQ